jgi:hypothetical protein
MTTSSGRWGSEADVGLTLTPRFGGAASGVKCAAMRSTRCIARSALQSAPGAPRVNQ